MNLSALTEPGPECVHFASVAEIAAFLERPCDLAVFHLSEADLRSGRELLTRIAREMEFPAWFGENFDALNDCLRDLDWHPAPGYVLIVWDAEMGTPDVLHALRRSWEFCAP